MHDSTRPRPFWQADLGVSVRKVSNGYSVKINHSIFEDAVGKIIIANGKEEVFEVLDKLFTECDTAPEDIKRNGAYRDEG
jgi:hypothetical protein